ncbi:response regulator transcription factor [Neobacillus dielmonensis]|uniref:response regulator transcription factor n=1 Tax=Neobacillus dielmonensis TaxID=1347369 RepID=UPI0005A903F4|nr:response regulator [Neobacillus dielmonensis]
MHKVVIVDDDRIIRKGLSKVIPWAKHGFELAGLAADGVEGLDVIKKTDPQIVISDIQMPFMDGLEMTRAIKKFNSKTKIILLTGYQDFKYAHQAIQLKAFDFLLKPIETSELIEKLEQASMEIERENQIECQIHDSHEYRQQQFLKTLCLRPLNNQEMFKELSMIGIHPVGSISVALSVKLDQTEFPSALKTNIMKECREYIKTAPLKGFVLNDDGEQFGLFIFSAETSKDMFAQSIADLARELLNLIKNKFQTTVTITRGRVYKQLTDLRYSYLESLKAMDFRHIMGINCTYSIEAIDTSQWEERGDAFEVEHELLKYVTLGLPDKVSEVLEVIKRQIKIKRNMTLQDTVLLAIRIVHLIGYESAKIINNWDETKILELENKLIKMQIMDDIFTEIERLALEAADMVKNINRNRKHTLVKKAIDFINDHYQCASLNLQTVADEVHVSYAYLSNLFKVELGYNFGEILLEKRMNRAIELFQQSDLKTYEVAEQTGYSNSNYFSSSFKKYTGFSPAEFKKMNHSLVKA